MSSNFELLQCLLKDAFTPNSTKLFKKVKRSPLSILAKHEMAKIFSGLPITFPLLSGCQASPASPASPASELIFDLEISEVFRVKLFVKGTVNGRRGESCCCSSPFLFLIFDRLHKP